MYPRVLPAMWPKCPGWGMYPEGPSWGFPGVPDEVWGAWEEAGWWKGGSTFHLATCLPFSCRIAASEEEGGVDKFTAKKQKEKKIY